MIQKWVRPPPIIPIHTNWTLPLSIQNYIPILPPKTIQSMKKWPNPNMFHPELPTKNYPNPPKKSATPWNPTKSHEIPTTFSPFRLLFSASSAVKTTFPVAAPGDAGSPRVSRCHRSVDETSSVGCSSWVMSSGFRRSRAEPLEIKPGGRWRVNYLGWLLNHKYSIADEAWWKLGLLTMTNYSWLVDVGCFLWLSIVGCLGLITIVEP